MVEELDVSKLNSYFQSAESCDKELFSEMRHNLLMLSGKYYSEKAKRLNERLQTARADERTKVRLSKNHLHKITRIYISEILGVTGGVKAVPHADSELQDQKASELANSVIQDARHRHRLDEKHRDLVEDFVDLGEMCSVIKWSKEKGSVIGMKQAVDEKGQPLFKTPDGQITPLTHAMNPLTKEVLPNSKVEGTEPEMSGDFCIETVHPFNLLRDPNAESMNESRWLIVRKMMDIADARLLANGDKEIIKQIESSGETTFKVFDAQKADFVDSKDQVLIREFYFRPCSTYKNGWYVLCTDSVIIYQAELPFGIWPVTWAGFQKIQTTPRAHSIIRNLRPLQANLNQLSSQQLNHQLTVGDDKMIIQGGSKVEKGGDLPGIRVLRVSGPPPVMLEGRTGEQFVQSIAAAVAEMYEIANLAEMREDQGGQFDAHTVMYRSAKHKKKFSLYAQTVEQYLKDFYGTLLKLAQKYYTDAHMVKVVGRREWVNIPEFSNVSELDYAIELESVADDVDQMAKAMQIQNILQYVGKDLTPEAVAQFISQMPNVDQAGTSEVMANVKNADNDILALDRGTYVPATKGEKHSYVINRLMGRMKMRDFSLLAPEIQQNYQKKVVEHQGMIAEEMREKQALEQSMIPVGGALISTDLYIEVPSSTGAPKTVRWRAPYDALKKLHDDIETQKMAMMQYSDLPPAAVGGVNQAMNVGQPQSGVMPDQQPQQQPMPTPGQGATHGTQPEFGNTQ